MMSFTHSNSALRRSIRLFGRVIAAFVALLLGVPASAQVLCPLPSPIESVGGARWYADSKGSIVDKEIQRRDIELQKRIRDFLIALEVVLDEAADISKRDCAFRRFNAWARAGALLKDPRDGPQADITEIGRASCREILLM